MNQSKISTILLSLLLAFVSYCNVNAQCFAEADKERLAARILSAATFRLQVQDSTSYLDSCDIVVCVDSDGSVVDAAIVRSSGNRTIDTTALRTSLSMLYELDSTNATARTFGDLLRWQGKKITQEYPSSNELHFSVSQLDAVYPLIAFQVELDAIEQLRSGRKTTEELGLNPDFPPQIVSNPPIPLPDSYNNTIGSTVRAQIGENGNAIAAQIVKSSLVEYKDSLALRQVLSSVYQPGMHGGYTIKSHLEVEVNFVRALKSEKKEQLPNRDTALLVGFPPEDEFIPVESAAEMVNQYPPRYPMSVMERGISGIVWIKSLIDTTGEVRVAKVMKSSGITELDEAAVEAAWKCTFKPGMRDGKPVSMWVSYKVTFALSK